MSARSQRGVTPTTKRNPTPRLNPQNRPPKQITYDYDAAISQPDVPNLLDFRKNGRGTMVSGVPFKKRSLKARIRCRVMSRKNFQKRSQTFRPKSTALKHAKTRPPEENRAKNTIAPSDVSEEEKDVVEKENTIDNNEAKDNLPVLRKKSETVEATREEIENGGDNQITRKKVKNERQEDCDSITAKSPVLQIKSSRIPRAKITAGPVHNVQEFHSAKKTTGDKIKNTTCLNCTSVNCTPKLVK